MKDFLRKNHWVGQDLMVTGQTASSHLYEKVGRSVGPSVRQYVGLSIGNGSAKKSELLVFFIIFFLRQLGQRLFFHWKEQELQNSMAKKNFFLTLFLAV